MVTGLYKICKSGKKLIEIKTITKEDKLGSACPFAIVRPAAHVSNGLKSRIRPVVGRI